MKKLKFILIIFLLFIIYVYITFFSLLPSKIFLLNNEQINLKKLPGVKILETTITNNSESDIYLQNENIKELDSNLNVNGNIIIVI